MNHEHYEALPANIRVIVDAASEPRATEATISSAIDLVIGDLRFYPDVRLHPNETGVLINPETGRYTRFGAGGKGGGDFIGMFRRADSTALFIEAEIKRPIASSKQSAEQIDRERLVESMGGSYRVLRSVEDAEQWIAELRRRFA